MSRMANLKKKNLILFQALTIRIRGRRSRGCWSPWKGAAGRRPASSPAAPLFWGAQEVGPPHHRDDAQSTKQTRRQNGTKLAGGVGGCRAAIWPRGRGCWSLRRRLSRTARGGGEERWGQRAEEEANVPPLRLSNEGGQEDH